MLTLENEYYIRLILLILRGGILVLRQILLKKLEDRNLQLSRFLQINRETINRLQKDNVLTLKQYHILFPNNGTMTDIDKLDISIFSCLLLNMFTPSMQRSEVKAIENIRTLRNDFVAHHPDGSIGARTFFRKWNQLSVSIINLGQGLSSEQRSVLAEVIKCTGDDPIDISCAMQDMKDVTDTVDESLEQVSQQLEQLSLKVQEISTCQEDTLAEIRRLEVAMRTVIENGKSDISTVIVGEVTVSGRNQEAVTAAAATLIGHARRSRGYISRLQEALQTGRQGIMNKIYTLFAYVRSFFRNTDLDLHLTQEEENESQTRVTSFMQDVHDAGGVIIDVTEGSLLLHIRCQSVAVMLAVLEYFRSSLIEQRLNDIEKCLTEESGCKINLTACIQVTSLQEALHTIQEKQTPEFTKTVRFSIKCQNAEGVLNVFNVFEGNSGSDSISKSNEVGGPVTLRTSVDKDTVRQYIGDALKVKEPEYSDASERQRDPPLKKGLGVPTSGRHDYTTRGSFIHKDDRGFARRREYESLIRLLEKGSLKFIAVSIYHPADTEWFMSYNDELDKTLQSLTGIDRHLLCQSEDFPFFLRFDFYPGMASVVIVYVTENLRDITSLKEADNREMEIIPMFREEDEQYTIHLLKGVRNLSNVRIVLKIENGKYILKSPLREVCEDILEAAARASKRQRDPPLKERHDDLPLLEEMFEEEKYRNKLSVPAVGMHDCKATGSFHKGVHGFVKPTDYKRFIRNLETGGFGYRFTAVLLHHPEYRGLPNSVFDELDKTLQSLTEIDRRLLVLWHTDRQSLDYYLDMSSVVIVYVAKMMFTDISCLKMTEDRELEIIPMFLENDEEYTMDLLQGVRNLSKVRIVLKIENGRYILKRPSKEVCKDILEAAAHASVRRRSSLPWRSWYSSDDK